MTALPTGTVTLLMTDMVGSTPRWTNGPEMTDRDLDLLHEVISASVGVEGGALIKSRGEGDSYFAAFDRPSAALAAAAAIQRCCTKRTDAPSVRIAVTMGELCPREDDYVGALVNRAARIRSAAHGGQIVCTRPVADVAMPVADLSVRSLGSYRIKDIADSVELFQVCGEGLPASFPPLCTLDTAATPVMTIVVVDEVGSQAGTASKRRRRRRCDDAAR